MATFTVTTALDENNGSVGGVSLREAIQAANSSSGPDIIEFDPSLSGSVILLELDQLDITDSVTIVGLGAGNLTIDAQGNSRVFNIDDRSSANASDVTISGLTITGGVAPTGSLGGGGIDNRENLTISDSIITGNSAGFGGGGINNRYATLTLTNSVVNNNEARVGGGLYNRYATAVITDSTFSSNEASVDGGGILNSKSNITLTKSTLNENKARNGGGILNESDSTLTLINSTVSSNEANFQGGGILNRLNSTATLTSSTLTGNKAKNNGGGILNDAMLNLANSLISGNDANSNNTRFGRGDEIANEDSGDVNADANNLFGHSGLTNADAFVDFTPGGADITATSDGTDATALTDILDTSLSNNGGATQTHALVPGSPAIDAGNNSQSPGATDQRGEDRVVDGSDPDDVATIDIGAFEECFLTGTRILTDRGEVPVEHLQIGDRVQTVDGKYQPIKWIGRQTREPGHIRNPLRGYPIHIKSGALGNGLPHRDLFVSPDHAVLFEDLLINAGALVNDISILKTTPTQTFVYYHIELEQHALLIAEGSAAESYLPQREDRLVYDNGAEYEDLYPNGEKILLWPLDYPRISSYTTVPRYIRRKLKQIAADLELVETVA